MARVAVPLSWCEKMTTASCKSPSASIIAVWHHVTEDYLNDKLGFITG